MEKLSAKLLAENHLTGEEIMDGYYEVVNGDDIDGAERVKSSKSHYKNVDKGTHVRIKRD